MSQRNLWMMKPSTLDEFKDMLRLIIAGRKIYLAQLVRGLDEEEMDKPWMTENIAAFTREIDGYQKLLDMIHIENYTVELLVPTAMPHNPDKAEEMARKELAASRWHSCGLATLGDQSFSREICPEPCNTMHYHCNGCGKITDGCAHMEVAR